MNYTLNYILNTVLMVILTPLEGIKNVVDIIYKMS